MFNKLLWLDKDELLATCLLPPGNREVELHYTILKWLSRAGCIVYLEQIDRDDPSLDHTLAKYYVDELVRRVW